MKKFKVKNRPKRKYVKKNDLAQSYSSVQSLTVGLVPLLLMAIAFFTTIIMTSSYTANLNLPSMSLSLPQISIPKTTFPEIKVNTPALPKITIPEILAITLPKVTIPNPFPMIEKGISNFIIALGTSMEIAIENLRAIFENISSTTLLFLTSIRNGVIYISEQIFTALHSGLMALGMMFLFFIPSVISGTINVAVNTLLAIQNMYSQTLSTIHTFGNMLQQISIQCLETTINLSTAALNATINGFNALVWFLGTPFRALHAYSIELGRALAPYGQFLADAFKHASDDLNQGGENLVNGTVYVTNTVENNNKND